MLDLYDEFQKLITALNQRQIDYALCGGIAMAIYDHPRATVDIDLLIDSASLDELLTLVAKLDYTIRGLDMRFAEGAVEIRRVSKIDGQTGQVLSLDLLLVTPELQRVWESRVTANWEGGTLSVVSREGLISLKRKLAVHRTLLTSNYCSEILMTRQIDMSAAAVTARLKLASQLRRLCLSLATARINSPKDVPSQQTVKPRSTLTPSENSSK